MKRLATKRGCKEETTHGIEIERWVYSVSDGEVAISLSVFAANFPASVPEDVVEREKDRYPFPAGIALHVGFPIKEGGREYKRCEFLDGGKCYGGGRFSSATGAVDFFDLNFRPESGFDQPERFWVALEQELTHCAPDARNERRR